MTETPTVQPQDDPPKRALARPLQIDGRVRGETETVIRRAVQGLRKPLRERIAVIWCNSASVYDYTVVLQAGTVKDLERIGAALQAQLLGLCGGHAGLVVGYKDTLIEWPPFTLGQSS